MFHTKSFGFRGLGIYSAQGVRVNVIIILTVYGDFCVWLLKAPVHIIVIACKRATLIQNLSVCVLWKKLMNRAEPEGGKGSNNSVYFCDYSFVVLQGGQWDERQTAERPREHP